MRVFTNTLKVRFYSNQHVFCFRKAARVEMATIRLPDYSATAQMTTVRKPIPLMCLPANLLSSEQAGNHGNESTDGGGGDGGGGRGLVLCVFSFFLLLLHLALQVLLFRWPSSRMRSLFCCFQSSHFFCCLFICRCSLPPLLTLLLSSLVLF